MHCGIPSPSKFLVGRVPLSHVVSKWPEFWQTDEEKQEVGLQWAWLWVSEQQQKLASLLMLIVYIVCCWCRWDQHVDMTLAHRNSKQQRSAKPNSLKSKLSADGFSAGPTLNYTKVTESVFRPYFVRPGARKFTRLRNSARNRHLICACWQPPCASVCEMCGNRSGWCNLVYSRNLRTCDYERSITVA